MAAQVSGKVFNDFNTNGVFDTDPNAGAVDVGVAGLTVRAFTGTDTLVGTATTASDGTYSLNLPNEKVRLELGVVRPWWPSQSLNGLRSDVQFVDASSALTGVNFGVHRLTEFSVNDPTLFWPTQWTGPPVTGNTNLSQFAIRGAPYSSKRTAGPPTQVQDWGSVAGHVGLATFGDVGTVFGLAINQHTGDLYAGAYYKRFAGLKNRSPGAIYKITQAKQVTTFTTLNAGTDHHPTSDNIQDWIQCDGATVDNPGNCDTSWNFVGKEGLGSVVIDPAGRNLYAVNLFDKSLYRLPLVASRRRRRARDSRRDPAPIPDPGCVGGVWRPFSAAFDPVNGQLYVGGVCDAETLQIRGNLRAVVYRVDDPRSGTPSFQKVLDFPLGYTRNSSAMTPCGAPNLCAWRPWPTVDSTGGKAPTSITQDGQTITENNNPSFPQLTAITFTADGSMTLGIRDLIGDMGGVQVPGEIGTGGQGGLGPMLHGDMLGAGPEPNGDFTLEANGRVAGIISAGQATSPINWQYGAGVGPGGGYFYSAAPLVTSLHNYPFPYQGGLTQIPGFPQVVATSIHVKTAQANGLLWRDNATGGTQNDGLQNYVTTNDFTGFAKSNGLGDLDAYRMLAPVQIGNRLWYDENDNGIQDAGEPPVTDTIVELVDCHGTVVAKARTDSNGEYVFPIAPGTCYVVRVPLDQPALNGWEPTTRRAGDDRRLDSNGRDVNGRSVAFVVPHGVGQNDFTYDFGFRRIPPPPEPQPPKPQPPVPEPPAPPAPDHPGVVPPSGPLVLVKHVVRSTSSTIEYAVIVRNDGPNTVTHVRVCDRLPAGLRYVSATSSGRRVIGGLVCWRIASLASGGQQTLHLTTQARTGALAGTMVNCATARGIGTPTAPNVPGKRVGPVRACATVHAPIRPPPPVVTG